MLVEYQFAQHHLSRRPWLCFGMMTYCFIEIHHVFFHGHLVRLGVYVLLYGTSLIGILVDKVAQCNFVCNVYL